MAMSECSGLLDKWNRDRNELLCRPHLPDPRFTSLSRQHLPFSDVGPIHALELFKHEAVDIERWKKYESG